MVDVIFKLDSFQMVNFPYVTRPQGIVLFIFIKTNIRSKIMNTTIGAPHSAKLPIRFVTD